MKKYVYFFVLLAYTSVLNGCSVVMHNIQAGGGLLKQSISPTKRSITTPDGMIVEKDPLLVSANRAFIGETSDGQRLYYQEGENMPNFILIRMRVSLFYGDVSKLLHVQETPSGWVLMQYHNPKDIKAGFRVLNIYLTRIEAYRGGLQELYKP